MSGKAEQPSEVTREEVERVFKKLDEEAESAGYHLNPDKEFTLGLIEGMLVNERRYGYWACPCRLASGRKSDDLDIICPCDYRDPDITDYGTCYCGLYVSQDVVEGKRKVTRIPERRPPEGAAESSAPVPPAPVPPAPVPPAPAERMSGPSESGGAAQPGAPPPGLPSLSGLRYPLWRCKVCGYLCARGQPPEVCPICRAKKDRFERLL